MPVTFRRLGTSELLPRYIFAESLSTRRRVLEVDAVAATAGESARFLSERGARLVVACDADLAAVEAAQKAHGSPALRFRPPIYDDLESGGFDLILVADLAPYTHNPQRLGELARLLARGGWLLGGLRNPAGLALWQLMEPEEGAPPTYGQLLDALSPHFPQIGVATQTPVLGYQLAFESLEDLQVDGSLVGSSEAAYYVVVAGREPLRALEPTWVQLPPAPLAFNRGRLDEAAQRARRWEERSESLKEAVGRLRAELTEREAQVARLEPALEGAREEVARLTARLEQTGGGVDLARERDELAARLRRLELELQVVGERLVDAERRLGQQRLEVEAAQRARGEAQVQVLAAQEALRLERARRQELSTSLEEARERLAQAYASLRQMQEELATLALVRERDRQEAASAQQRMQELLLVAEAARERELRLADQYSAALAALEHLKAEVARAEDARLSAEQVRQVREAELARALRELEAVSRRLPALDAGRQEAEVRLTAREVELRGLETELAAARNLVEQLRVQVEGRARSEASARAVAAQLEQALHETRARLEALEQEQALREAEGQESKAQESEGQESEGQESEGARVLLAQTRLALDETLRSQLEAVEALSQARAELEAERQRRERSRGELSQVRARHEVQQQERLWGEQALLKAWGQLEDERYKQAELQKELLRLRGELGEAKQERYKAQVAHWQLRDEMEARRRAHAAAEQALASAHAELEGLRARLVALPAPSPGEAGEQD